jgi:hypothetical protein
MAMSMDMDLDVNLDLELVPDVVMVGGVFVYGARIGSDRLHRSIAVHEHARDRDHVWDQVYVQVRST